MKSKKPDIDNGVQRGYNDLGGREEGRIVKANVARGRGKETKCLVEPPFTTRNLRPRHHRSLVSRATMRRAQNANPFAQVTRTSWSQDMTQKD